MSLDRSFIPNAHIDYPEQTDRHYMKITKDDGTIFDKNYPYIDHSKKFAFKRFFIRMGLFLIVYPVSYIRFGLKIRGKKNLRKNKKLLKQGCLSIANHVHKWDYIMIMNAIKPRRPNVLVWNKNVSDKDGPLVRLVGGIPIPEHDMQATIKYMEEVDNLLNSGGWLHIYPEGSMWEYYRYIRPFKKGVAHLAKKNDKPIVPFAFSYRRPGWIRRNIFHQIACFNLCIGEPLFIDKSLPVNEQEEDLLIRCHQKLNELAGLDEQENPYAPIFTNDKKIDMGY